MAKTQEHPLLTQANLLRADEGRSIGEYLHVLLQIRELPVLWKEEYSTFKEFLDKTDHGPYERFMQYVELQETLLRHDMAQGGRIRRGSRSTMAVVGFHAASQVLTNTDEGPNRKRVIEALRGEAEAQGRPLTYQRASAMIYSILKIEKIPRSASGSVLRALHDQIATLVAEKTLFLRIIRNLQSRLRKEGLSDTLPSFASEVVPPIK